jgi:hypothetical protein
MTTYPGRKAPITPYKIVQALIWFTAIEVMLIGVWFIPSYTEIINLLNK